MAEYLPTIGLEIHAELKTRTKMFCDSRNDPDETRPNVNVCPVCMGHPGTLPVINREAVKQVLRVGVALGGNIADCTEFDRKNYFYPDIPKGYQISQYKHPLVSGGTLNGVVVTRVHLEEDTATSQHLTIDSLPLTEDPESKVKGQRSDASLVDFNRAGVPLMELVTEPVIHSAKEAADFARELQLVLRYLGASDAHMEKGEMRVEANISVAKQTEMFASAEGRGLDADSRRNWIPRNSASSQRGSAVPLGTKVEVKNLNSFRAVERAIEYEVKRQSELLEMGEEVIQETRGWDEQKGQTFSQRRKEKSHDYRYFPEPDLPKLLLSGFREFQTDALRKTAPELPQQVRARYARDFGLKGEDIETLLQSRAVRELFEGVAHVLSVPAAIQLATNYLVSDVMGLMKKTGEDTDCATFRFSATEFAELIEMISSGELSSRGAKDILAVLFESGGTPRIIAHELGVVQQSDAGELRKVISEIISVHQKVAADYKSGKEAALQFLVGQGMKATKGAANPELLRELIVDTLNEVGTLNE